MPLSASARGLWIEIIAKVFDTAQIKSASARGLWIEIRSRCGILCIVAVSFREGAVD